MSIVTSARPLARLAMAGSIAAIACTLLRAQGARAWVYVTVVNDAGEAVRGLGAADFALRDGGQRQAVLDAVPATDPLAIAIVTDGFAASDASVVSKAIADMGTIETRVPGSKVGLIQSNVPLMIDPASPPGAPPIHPPGESLDLAGKVRAACRALDAAAESRRTIVLALDRSSSTRLTVDPSTLLEEVSSTRAAVWVVEVGVAPAPPTPLDDFLQRAIDASGSVRQSAATAGDLPRAAGRVVDLLASQYLVTYAWPDPMLSRFDLETRHDAGHVLVASWR